MKQGGNIIIFPEGTWNRTHNLLVQDLHSGVYRIAHQTSCPVIPISTMMYDDKVYIRRGQAMYLDTDSEEKSLRNLRDTLATQIWMTMENNGVKKRSDLLKGLTPNDYWDKHVRDYVATQGFYDYELEESARFITIQEKAQKSVLLSIKNTTP